MSADWLNFGLNEHMNYSLSQNSEHKFSTQATTHEKSTRTHSRNHFPPTLNTPPPTPSHSFTPSLTQLLTCPLYFVHPPPPFSTLHHLLYVFVYSRMSRSSLYWKSLPLSLIQPLDLSFTHSFTLSLTQSVLRSPTHSLCLHTASLVTHCVHDIILKMP